MMEIVKTPAKLDRLKQTLRTSGYKATPGRLAILEIFNAAKRPLAAQEIVEMLPRTDQATIYRTLKSLARTGIIHPIDLRHNHAHYELTDIAEHHHLICLRCGRIEDVRHCGVEEIQDKVLRGSKHFGEIQQHALEFYGLCKSCMRKRLLDATSPGVL
jgi:Fur family transcriptional regulator, ferric uptake regulator